MDDSQITPRIQVPAAGGDGNGPRAADAGAPTVKLPPPDSSAVPAAAGMVSSQYAVLKKIGDGGMGVVYLGRDVSLGRYVAIKRLNRASLAQSALRRRFLREAKAVAALNHIHIVHVYALGEDDAGPYIVMEYVSGPTASPTVRPPPPLTLADRVHRDGPMGLEDAIDLLLKLCRAVEYAHGCGVIHRDLKPTNVLLDESGEPKIVDFGLARRAEQTTGPITVPGEKMLSLGYGAPEQESDASATDERADVYGLGGILYFSITGQNPRYFRETDVPDAVRTALVKALKTDRENRWRSAREFAEALQLIKAPTRIEIPTVKTTWRCKWCDTVNPTGIQYCGECGWDGRETCAECGAETRVGIQFCGECGANAREYEAATRLLARVRDHSENKEYDRVDQQAGAIASFTPIGPSGRKIVRQVQDLLRRSRQALDRRAQIRQIVPQEIASQNYERARQYIEEYNAVAGDNAFARDLANLPDLTIERDLKRARRAASRREWIDAEAICRGLLDRVAPNNAEARRLLAAVRRQRLRLRLRAVGSLVLAVFFAYVYSGAPAYRAAGATGNRAWRAVYGPLRFLRDVTALRDPLDLYARLWSAADMFAPLAHPRPPAAVAAPAAATAGEDMERLKGLRLEYAQAMEKTENEHTQRVSAWPNLYIDALTGLRQQMQRQGDFEGWLAVEDEIERFSAGRALSTADLPPGGPPALRALQTRFERTLRDYYLDRSRQIVQATDAYASKLGALRKKLTVSGNMVAAREVNAELIRVKASPWVTAAEAAVKAAGQPPKNPPQG